MTCLFCWTSFIDKWVFAFKDYIASHFIRLYLKVYYSLAFRRLMLFVLFLAFIYTIKLLGDEIKKRAGIR